MKKWLLRISILLVVLLIIGLVVVYLNINTIVERGVETVGPQIAKVDVRVGSATISPMNGNGELNKLFVGNPEGYNAPSAIEVGNVRVALKVSSLLKNTIEIEEIVIKSPMITFEGGLTGNNLMTILKNLETAPEDVKPTPEGEPASDDGKKYFVKNLVVTNGSINVIVTSLSAKAMTVPLPPIHLTNIGSENAGVTAAQLAKEILKPVIRSATKEGMEAITGLSGDLKEIGKDAADRANDAVKGVRDIFKRP